MHRRLLIALCAVISCGGGNGFFVISGTIRTPTPDGRLVGVPGATVSVSTYVPPGVIITGGIFFSVSSTTDAQGNYSITTENGLYTLSAGKEGFDGASSAEPLTLRSDRTTGQDLVILASHSAYLQPSVSGVAAAGTTVHMSGPVAADVQVGADGTCLFGPLPDGQYTLTASSPGAVVFPATTQAVVQRGSFLFGPADFFAVPAGAVAGTATIQGDALSGVKTSVVQLVPNAASFDLQPPVASVAVTGTSGLWEFGAWLPPAPNLPQRMYALLTGDPAVGTANLALDGSLICVAPAWVARKLTLTLTSVGPALTGHNAVRGDQFLLWLVHGTAHFDCTGPTPGAVTVDITF